MKLLHTYSFFILLISCSNAQSNSKIIKTKSNIEKPEFQRITDSANVVGSILVYDFDEDKYYSNDFEWAKRGYLPASTFKIPNSIIALETGIIMNNTSIIKWDGHLRNNKNWNQDLVFRDALHYSCVPCYQEIARKIGHKRMKEYLDILKYETMKFDSTNIDMFWLTGDSRISQFEQIKFLKAFNLSKLAISKRTESIIKKMILIEENDSYKISGKTGWSSNNGEDNAWFVGFLESKGKTFYFATNIEPNKNLDLNEFAYSRKKVTFDAFKILSIID